MEALNEESKKRGPKATKPNRNNFTTRLDDDLHRTLEIAKQELSVQDNRPKLSVADIVNDSINFYFDCRGIKKI